MRSKLPWILSLIASTAGAFAQQVGDFALEDANPASVRFQSPVSPRDYLLQVTGFYFGTATS